MNVVNSGIVLHTGTVENAQSLTFPMICVTSSGRWLCACRAAPHKIPNTGQRPLLTLSDDTGNTWSAPRAPFTPPHFRGTPGLFRFAGLTDLGDGHILAAINWVDNTDPGAPYFNEATEGLLDTRIYLSHSYDNGDSWSEPQWMNTAPYTDPTPLTGPILKLNDGTLACQIELNKPYDDTSPWRHASVLLFSSDEGRTWPRHCVVTQDPTNRIFYWDQRQSVLPDGSLFAAFWTFDRERNEYLKIHTRTSRDNGATWTPLRDTGIAGQPGPACALSGGSVAMPVVDREGAPKIQVRRSSDGGTTWPEDESITIYDSAATTQTRTKNSMQDAWAEMYAFSVGLPHAAPLPGGGAIIVYYAGSETDQTAIHWAEVR